MKKQKTEKAPEDSGFCCFGGGKKGFPTFAVVILVIGISWLLNELKILAFEIPWFPLILIVIAIGWIVDYYKKK
jgi:hypothetical protein